MDIPAIKLEDIGITTGNEIISVFKKDNPDVYWHTTIENLEDFEKSGILQCDASPGDLILSVKSTVVLCCDYNHYICNITAKEFVTHCISKLLLGE